MINKLIKWSIVLVLLFTFGCNLPLDRKQGIGKLEDQLNIKLDGMIGINSQIGSMIGYNNKLLNSSLFYKERLYQQLNGMPNSQVTFQQFKKVRSKYRL